MPFKIGDKVRIISHSHVPVGTEATIANITNALKYPYYVELLSNNPNMTHAICDANEIEMILDFKVGDLVIINSPSSQWDKSEAKILHVDTTQIFPYRVGIAVGTNMYYVGFGKSELVRKLKYNVGDYVEINSPGDISHGKLGKVVAVNKLNNALYKYEVEFQPNTCFMYRETELKDVISPCPAPTPLHGAVLGSAINFISDIGVTTTLKSNTNTCNHKWENYVGLTHSFIFCNICQIKKNEKLIYE